MVVKFIYQVANLFTTKEMTNNFQTIAQLQVQSRLHHHKTPGSSVLRISLSCKNL